MRYEEIESIDDLVSRVIDVYNKLCMAEQDYPTVDIVADYTIIGEVVKVLLYEYNYDVYSANIEDPGLRESDVFTCTISPEGLWIMPTYDNEFGWDDVVTVTFVHEDVPSGFVISNKNMQNVMIEFDYEMSDCDGDCDNCYHNLSPTNQAIVDFLTM